MANDTETTPTEMVDDTTPTETKPPTKTSVPEDPEAIRAELERTRAALAKSNKEAATRRHRLEELEAAERERENSNLSEQERTKRAVKEAEAKATEAASRAAAAEAALERTKIDAAVEREASKMGFIYPDIAPQLIDRDRVSIDPDTGKIEGAKEALERLVKDKPDLQRSAPRGGSPPREGPRGRFNDRDRDRERGPTLEEELRANGNYSV